MVSNAFAIRLWRKENVLHQAGLNFALLYKNSNVNQNTSNLISAGVQH